MKTNKQILKNEGEMMKQVKITEKESRIIGSVLSQKLNVKLGKSFNARELLPYLSDDYIRFSILHCINQISEKSINKFGIAKEIKSLKIKLNK